MTIDWGLLGPPVDIAGSFQAGMQRGRQLRMQGTRDRAVSALAADPTNTAALSAFASVDPEGAARFESIQAQRAERESQSAFRSALSGAYDPATGAIDPVKARSAFVAAGDVPGAMQFDQQQASSRAAQLKQAHDNLSVMSRLIDDATDEESYQRSVASARELGLDTSKVPPNFDPAYIAQLKQQTEALRGDVQRELMAVAPGTVVIDKGTGQQVYQNPDRPRYYAVPPGGRLELDPSYQGPVSQPSPTSSTPPGASSGPFSVVGVPGDRETSRRRSPEHNRKVGGVPNSYHISGRASDRVPPAGMSMDTFAAELQRLNPTLEVINEGDHVHLEPRGGGGSNHAQLRAEAAEAIAKGADPVKVNARLREMGVN